MKLNRFLAAAALLAVANVQAQEAATDRFDFLLTLGITQGGDDLAEVDYEDGPDEKIEAGSGFIVGAGGVIAIGDTNLDAQISLNYHGDSAEADDGEASMERTAMDALLFYTFGAHRLGGGITRHSNVEYDIDVDDVIDMKVDFDDAIGLVLEYNYVFNDTFGLGLRYTNVEYEASDFDDSLDGSHFGIIFDVFL